MSARLWLAMSASISMLAACATHQENPNYAYSTKYKADAPTTTHASAPTTYAHSTPANYQSGATTTYASSTPIDQECLRREKNRELLGAGLGGAAGAFAGKELIGGTTGTVIGAGVGGIAGYGIGDVSVDCSPQIFAAQPTTQAHQSQTVQSQTAQRHIITQDSYSVPSSHQATSHQYVSSDQTRVVYQSPRVTYQAPTDTQFASISDTGTPGYQVLQSQTVVQAAPTQYVAAPTQYTQTSTSSAQLVDYDYSQNVVSANSATIAGYSQTRSYGNSAQSGHIVKQGDTVYSLARKHCVGVNDIKSLNGLDRNFAIKIGDSLNLPSSRC